MTICGNEGNLKKQKKKMNKMKIKRKTQDMEGNLTQTNTNDEQWLVWL